MDIQPRTTVAAPVDQQEWIASMDGIDSTFTGTADVALFTLTADGYIASGTPIVQDGTSKKWGPAITLAGDPEALVQAADCLHVYEAVKVSADSTVAGIAIYWRGRVASELLPVPDGFTFDKSEGSAHILYV